MTDPVQFQDIADFDLQRQQLARRRKIAEELLQTRMPEARMQGNYAILPGAGNTLAAGFDRALGNWQSPKIDAEEVQNRMAERDASDLMLSNIPTSGPERTQAQIRAATRMPSLREAIKMQMVGDEAEANRIAKAQEAEQNRLFRVEEAERARIEAGEQKAADRVARSDDIRLRATTPNVNVSVANPPDPELAGLRKNLLREQIKAAAEKAGAANDKGSAPANDIAQSNTLLDQAEPLISKATGSGVGNLVDIGLSFIGQSTNSADAAAKLKSIQGALISKMPKMSGPQSDKDVQLYREMAGRIGDPNVPASQKKAALETVREINARYTGLANARPNAPPAANDDPLGIRGKK